MIVDHPYATAFAPAMRGPADFSKPAGTLYQSTSLGMLGEILLKLSLFVIAEMTWKVSGKNRRLDEDHAVPAMRHWRIA